MKRFKFLVAALIAVASIAVGVIVKNAGASGPDELQAAKAALSRFHSVQQAEAAGFIRMSPCESSPAGGMGFHYGNPALMADPSIDPLRPELLLYAPKSNGEVELVGVEYFRADADQNLSTDSDRPSVFGVPFEGPMLGHAPGMPIHYDRHVWLYESNPGGTFMTWNPSVKC